MITKKGRRFYHNTETKESDWNIPEHIAAAIRVWEARREAADAEARGINIHRRVGSSGDQGLDGIDERMDEQDQTAEPAEDDIEWQLAMLNEGHANSADEVVDHPMDTVERIHNFEVVLLHR